MGESLVERFGRGIDNVSRSIEIRLTDFQMNNIASFGFERFRFDQNFKRGLGSEPRHSCRKPKFALSSFVHNRGIRTIARPDDLSLDQSKSRETLQSMGNGWRRKKRIIASGSTAVVRSQPESSIICGDENCGTRLLNITTGGFR